MKIFVGLALATAFFFTYPAQATNYQQQYNNKVLVKQRVVEFDSRYYLGLNGYYAVGEQIANRRRDEKLEALQEEHNELKTQLKTLIDVLSKQNNTPQTPSEVPPNPSPTDSNPTDVTPTPEVPTDNKPYTATETDKAIYGIIKNRCSQCHSENNPKGDLTLINLKNGTLLSQPLETRVLMERMVRGQDLKQYDLKLMPKNGPALSDEELKVFYNWMFEGSREN